MMERTQPLICCVDDEEVNLKIITGLLTKKGYRVETATNGLEALEVIVATKPALILLDVMMPGLDGYEVCARLQKNPDLSYIPVIFATALADAQDKAKAFAVGAADYLTKPINKEKLLQTVSTHLATHRRWEEIRSVQKTKVSGIPPSDFVRFKTFLEKKLVLSVEQKKINSTLTPDKLYTHAGRLGLTEAEMAKLIAEFLHLPYVQFLSPLDITLGLLPPPFCRTNLVAPINIKESSTDQVFVCSNPFNWELITLLKKWKGQVHAPQLSVTEPQNILALFEDGASTNLQSSARTSMSTLDEELTKWDEELLKEEGLSDDVTEESGPIIRLANQLIEQAYAMGASDIHIEPWEKEVVVRYRIDGALRIVNRFQHRGLIRPLISRFKIMSELDIVERRLPQDGRIVFKHFSHRGADFDLRVASAPMNFGEKIVMRILDKRKSVLPLTDLGFSARNLALYRKHIVTPYGMVLHVGPTGSGKSMTLYSALNEVQRPDLNIQTIEDPIEYTLPGINQMQVHHEIGLTFQRALRSYLRQDPDVILVGEIRDTETAEIAVSAALTGHLLLSTLHTNDACSTVVRLMEMGIEPFMVSSSIILVCAQRLLRRLCTECKVPYTPNETEKELVGLPPEADITLFQAKGCEACNTSGYKGRVGIHEMLAPNDTMRRIITSQTVTAESLKRQAVEECDMTTLYWDAMEKVRAGLCSLDDALAKVRKDEFDARPGWMFTELGLPHPTNRDESASPSSSYPHAA